MDGPDIVCGAPGSRSVPVEAALALIGAPRDGKNARDGTHALTQQSCAWSHQFDGAVALA
jgi:hypothetical protein